MSADLLPEQAKVLREWTAGQAVGGLVVREATASLDEDVNGDVAVFLDVVVAPPLQGEPTWNVKDVLGLHALIDDKARELGFERPWYVRLVSEGDDEADVDDEGPVGSDSE